MHQTQASCEGGCSMCKVKPANKVITQTALHGNKAWNARQCSSVCAWPHKHQSSIRQHMATVEDHVHVRHGNANGKASYADCTILHNKDMLKPKQNSTWCMQPSLSINHCYRLLIH